jgi:acyl carrier protein
LAPFFSIRPNVIREVVARTCGQSVHDRDILSTDLHLDADDRAELLVALELALRCEARDVELTEYLTVADLIEALGSLAA